MKHETRMAIGTMLCSLAKGLEASGLALMSGLVGPDELNEQLQGCADAVAEVLKSKSWRSAAAGEKRGGPPPLD